MLNGWGRPVVLSSVSGVLLTVTLAGLIAGVRAQGDIEEVEKDVTAHVEAIGLHMTIPQASATATRIQSIEDATTANAKHLEQIDGDVMKIQEDISDIKESQAEQAVAAERTAGDIRLILDKLNGQ